LGWAKLSRPFRPLFLKDNQMEEKQKQIKKGWKAFWTIFDIIFFMAYFLLFLFIAGPRGTISYYDGLNETNIMFGLAFLIFPLTFLFIAVLVVRSIFWKRYFKSKKQLWLLIIAAVLCNPIFALICPIRPPGYKPFTAGFHQRMQNRLDVEKIRAWLGTLDSEIFDGEYYDLLYEMNGNVLPVPILEEINSLSEHVHYLVFYTENKMPCLRIEWGGALGHWGVVVGPREMEVPPSDFSDYGEYRLKLEEGVYIWHELQ
jgi:hypothetical protein